MRGLLFLSLIILGSPWALSATTPQDAPRKTPYPVIGALNQLLPRREIRDLQTNYPDQFNVFLLGLQRMQQTNQSDFLSYFRIAQIHGVPVGPWNGVEGIAGYQVPGFCTHMSNLFLPWHRPYLALFEQVLVSNALAAANQFPPGPTRDTYLTAADQLRLPYWDWAVDPDAGENSIPDCVTDATISIVYPNGTQTMPNPLYSYTFHPISPGLTYAPYISWPQTLRWPDSTAPNAQTQVNVLISIINSNQASMKQRLFSLLTTEGNFSQFGNMQASDNAPNAPDSMENIHNQVHAMVGGTNYGDMTVIAVSAFDPAFWLHHVMVDRAFALWQALWPDSYVEPVVQGQGTYWYAAGSTQDADSPLKPFYSDPRGDFWTSNTIKDHTKFGYTYSELDSGNVSDVMTAIKDLYGPSSTLKAAEKRKGRRDDASSQQEVVYRVHVSAPVDVDIIFGYKIHFFLGEPPSTDPATWLSDAVHTEWIMTSAVPLPAPTLPLASPMGPRFSSSAIPLNRALLEQVAHGRLANLSEAAVEAYLTRHLDWRISTNDGAVSPEELPGLRISVSSVVCTHRGQDKLPVWSEAKVFPKITSGRPGGHSS